MTTKHRFRRVWRFVSSDYGRAFAIWMTLVIGVAILAIEAIKAN